MNEVEEKLGAGRDEEPWRALVAGQRFTVTSRSGRTYTLVYLSSGPSGVGLYVRLDDRKLARVDPGLVRWDTLALGPVGGAIVPGDEVLFEVHEEGELHSGRIVEGSKEPLAIEVPGGLEHLPLGQARASSLRIAFTATRLYPGEEFRVTSLSGNSYTGLAERMTASRIRAVLRGDSAARVLHTDFLQPRSLRVLVPCAPGELAPVAT